MFLSDLGHLPLAFGWATIPIGAMIYTAGKDGVDARKARRELGQTDFWDGQHEGATEFSPLLSDHEDTDNLVYNQHTNQYE